MLQAKVINFPSYMQDRNYQAKAPRRRLSNINRQSGYRWRGCDPDMVELCKIITDSNLTPYVIRQMVIRASRNTFVISETTIVNWMKGKTKRPQNLTMTWVAYALGYERASWREID